jgi:branched-chain amino acid transport system permease protein
VFTMAVIGGVASLPGAILGALYVKGAEFFLPGNWVYLASGLGVLVVLMVLPGGLGGAVTQLRDEGLKAIARRRHLVVPSLLADHADADAPPRVSARTPAGPAGVPPSRAAVGSDP